MEKINIALNGQWTLIKSDNVRKQTSNLSREQEEHRIGKIAKRFGLQPIKTEGSTLQSGTANLKFPEVKPGEIATGGDLDLVHELSHHMLVPPGKHRGDYLQNELFKKKGGFEDEITAYHLQNAIGRIAGVRPTSTPFTARRRVFTQEEYDLTSLNPEGKKLTVKSLADTHFEYKDGRPVYSHNNKPLSDEHKAQHDRGLTRAKDIFDKFHTGKLKFNGHLVEESK